MFLLSTWLAGTKILAPQRNALLDFLIAVFCPGCITIPNIATAMSEPEMQQGSLSRSSRKRGPDVCQFRWADRGPLGERIYRRRVIGTLCQFPDSARKSLAGLVTEINMNILKPSALLMTIAQLCDHFTQRELAIDNFWRSYSTKRAYKAYLKRWIVPHWGSVRLSEVRTMEVGSWLRRLPLAKGSCAKIRNIFSVLFNHACRHELFNHNPLRLVRQGAKTSHSECADTPRNKGAHRKSELTRTNVGARRCVHGIAAE